MNKKLTTENGAIVSDDQNSLTAGERGPLLMQDWPLLEKLAHFKQCDVDYGARVIRALS